jgi:acyl-CoA thioesterase-1
MRRNFSPGDMTDPRRNGFGRYGPSVRHFNKCARIVTLAAIAFGVALGSAEAAPVKLLALGDSLTAGYGLQPEEAFPARLEAALKQQGLDVQVINAGVSGDTSAGGLARVDWALADKPNLALVELGANDALRGVDPRVTEGNLGRILAKLKAAGVPVLLMGLPGPGNFGKEYQDDFSAIYPTLAQKYAVPLYPFFLDGVALDPKLNQPDMLHPNSAGVDIIVDRVMPYVKRLIASVG